MLSLSYLILLGISFGAIYIYSRTSDDLFFTLAALTAVVCFFWGFALAPWIVQLLIVAFLLHLDKFYFANESRLG